MTQKGQNCFKAKKDRRLHATRMPPSPQAAKDLCRQIYNLQIFLEVLLKLAGKSIIISEDLTFFSQTTRVMGIYYNDRFPANLKYCMYEGKFEELSPSLYALLRRYLLNGLATIFKMSTVVTLMFLF